MKRYGIYLAWLLTMISLLTSLYYSEIKHMEPCNLCWFQRICLYPLTIILGMAVYRGDDFIVPYACTLSVIGCFFAIYQIFIQELPGFEPLHFCGSGPDCAQKMYIGIGKITIPMLSAVAFALITFFLLITRKQKNSYPH